MTTRGIDFAALTLMDSLDLAVLIEQEARERYVELAEQLELHHTPDAAAFFRKMVRVEELHRSELAARRKELFGDAPSKVTLSMIYDIEAPEYDEARANMTQRQALESSMRSEIKAHDFFATVLPQIKDAKVKQLFAELKDEEIEHQRWIRLELDKQPADPEAGHDDSDEPVAQ
jgi:rubrerythrin